MRRVAPDGRGQPLFGLEKSSRNRTRPGAPLPALGALGGGGAPDAESDAGGGGGAPVAEADAGGGAPAAGAGAGGAATDAAAAGCAVPAGPSTAARASSGPGVATTRLLKYGSARPPANPGTPFQSSRPHG